MSEIEHLKTMWISAREAALLTCATTQSIRNWYKKGLLTRRCKMRLPHYGPCYMYDKEEVLEMNKISVENHT